MNQEDKNTSLLAIITSVLIGAIGLALFPAVFSSVFANGELTQSELGGLTLFSISFLILAGLLFAFNKSAQSKLVLVSFGLSIVITLELLFRLAAPQFGDKELLKTLGQMSSNADEQQTTYVGNPFVQYTGRPGEQYRPEPNATATAFNKLGFVGDNRPSKKDLNTIRVACLGGSTTQRGYPLELEKLLNNHAACSSSVEVLNFGIAGWTTAHSLVNYVLNVVEFEPDLIIIHHAWNEMVVRNCTDEYFRADYSHRLTPFKTTAPWDKWLIKCSLTYRFVRYNTIRDAWSFLEGSTLNFDPSGYAAEEYSDLTETEPFDRNVRTLINLALLKKTKVLLTSMPRSTNLKTKMAEASITIDQNNQILRKIALDYTQTISFLDLDSIMNGKYDSLFIDIAHLNPSGRHLKASLISEQAIQMLPCYSQNEILP